MRSRAKRLLDRSVLAMAAAIELYNKPGLSYRNESFAILAVNGWELLLKARWLALHQNKVNSLYVYERSVASTGQGSVRRRIKRTQSRAPFTHGLLYLAGQLHSKGKLDTAVLKNLEVMSEIRDCAVHFYSETPKFNTRLFEFGAACVKNFANAVREWFERDVTEFNLQLMPLTFMDLPSSVEGTLPSAKEKMVLAFLDGIEASDMDPNSPYSISVNVELKFTKSKSKHAVPVQVTQDPSATAVTLTEEDIRGRYPWDYKTLTARCKERYTDFSANQQYHQIRKGLETDKRYSHRRFLDPGNTKSAKKTFFNPNIMSEFDKYYTKQKSSQ